MFIRLNREKNDNTGFVSEIEMISNYVIGEYLPEKIYIVKMKNGFDFKWLDFTGVANMQLGVWRDHLKIPPFNPSRVVIQNSFKKEGKYQYEKIEDSPLHVPQESSDDLRKCISDYSQSGVFFWWSGNTVFSKKGCLLVYIRRKNQSFGWYSSFWKGDKWEIFKTKGLSKMEIEEYRVE